MLKSGADREAILNALAALGGANAENVAVVARSYGVPEADIHGAASFYHLLADDDVERRVCTGLSCSLAGATEVLERLQAEGVRAHEVSCLGQCDRAVAVLDRTHELVSPGPRGPVSPDDPTLPVNLGGPDRSDYAGLAAVRAMGEGAFLDELERSGLQGRGGAGFPAVFKWRAVCGQAETERYLVCNADEGEPGTFKDREVMLRHPHQLLEGLAIAAEVIGACDVIIYIRGAFTECRAALEAAIAQASESLGDHAPRLVMGHGAYICGEETALLESLEGKRGMPRLKPPYPTESGFRGKPTLVHNVETLACLPDIALRGGERFRSLGLTEAGTKLYCLSGHVAHPGVYELPLGVSLDTLVEHAGGYVGTPQAFSPGGASSGFLPMTQRELPLDFGSLAKAGAMLGSAGVVVLNDTVDMAAMAHEQLRFFEIESCGQCAPCRLGTRALRQALGRYLDSGDPAQLGPVADLAWELEEGSICGLGIAAPLPLTSAMRYFPEAFQGRERENG